MQTAGPLHAARPPPALAWAAGAGSFPERPTLAALALRAGPSTTHLWTAPQADARGTTVPRSPPPLPNPCQALARRCARVSPAARRSSLITALATAASDRVASRAFNRGPPPRRQCHSGALSPNPCTVASPALWCSGTPSPGFHPRALALPAPAAQGSVAPAVDAVPAGGFRLLRLTPATLGPELRALLRIKHPGVPPTGWLSLEAAADVAEAATAAGPVVPVLQLALSPSTVRARCRAIEAGWSAAVAPGGGQLAGEAPHLRTPDGLVSRLVPVLAAEEAALRAIARGMTSRGTGREQRGSRPSLVHLTWREEGVSSRRRRRSAASAPRLPFLAHIGERGSLYLAVTEAVADGDWAKTLASRYLTALCVPAAACVISGLTPPCRTAYVIRRGFRSRCEGKGRLQVSWTRPDALAAAAEQGKETGGWAEEEWTAGPQSEWAASIAWDEEGEDGLPTSIRLTAAPSELASLPTVLWGPAVGRVDPMEARVGLSLDASATVQIAARDKLTHATCVPPLALRRGRTSPLCPPRRVTARVQCDGCRPTVVRLRGLVPGQAYEVLVLVRLLPTASRPCLAADADALGPMAARACAPRRPSTARRGHQRDGSEERCGAPPFARPSTSRRCSTCTCWRASRPLPSRCRRAWSGRCRATGRNTRCGWRRGPGRSRPAQQERTPRTSLAHSTRRWARRPSTSPLRRCTGTPTSLPSAHSCLARHWPWSEQRGRAALRPAWPAAGRC